MEARDDERGRVGVGHVAVAGARMRGAASAHAHHLYKRLKAGTRALLWLSLAGIGLATGESHAQGAAPTGVVAVASQPNSLLQLDSNIQLDRPAADNNTLLKLGPGDAVSLQVFGRPEFNATAYVGEDLNIPVPLAGPVRVGGMSPSEAASLVAAALKDGGFLIDPQVSITLINFRSQQVSVIGEVGRPGRFPLESKTTLLDLIALAGGITETGSDLVFLIRQDETGKMQRYSVDLKSLSGGTADIPSFSLQGGDSLFVPRAEQFYVYGEVNTPNMYRLESGTTVVQAIARSGGITPRGSESRIEIRRREADGKYRTFSAELTDPVQANDVIRVKERIF